MKKYLTLAAILGAIAFVSVSYLAQAEPQYGAPAATEKAATTGTNSAVAPTAYMKDSDECTTLASAATTEGATPTAEAKDATFKKCMMDKKHTEEEIAKEEAMKKEDDSSTIRA